MVCREYCGKADVDLCGQDIRNFTTLSVADAASVAPPASNMNTYDTSLENSNCADNSYMCAGDSVTSAAGDFYSYSME